MGIWRHRRALALPLLLAGAAVALSAQGRSTPDDVRVAPDAVRGLAPVIRLFCAPCLDRYAQEYRPRTLAWELRDIDDTAIARSRVWERRVDGALSVPAVPKIPASPAEPARLDPGDDSVRLVLLLDDAAFDPAHVYVLLDDVWTNLAWYLGLPEDRALPTLGGFIRVERAPPAGEPGVGEW